MNKCVKGPPQRREAFRTAFQQGQGVQTGLQRRQLAGPMGAAQGIAPGGLRRASRGSAASQGLAASRRRLWRQLPSSRIRRWTEASAGARPSPG